MDLAIIITLIVLAFGVGTWCARMEYKFNRLDDKFKKSESNIIPLIMLHREDLIKHYIEKGILPNPAITARKQYLLDRLKNNTISVDEYTELSAILQREKQEAQRTNNVDALVAILGLLALVAILSSLSKK